MVKIQYINIKTAINIQNLYPPGKALLLGEGGTGRATTTSTRTEKSKYENFNAGNLRNHYPDWEKITSDRIILDIIQNVLKIDFM